MIPSNTQNVKLNVTYILIHTINKKKYLLKLQPPFFIHPSFFFLNRFKFYIASNIFVSIHISPSIAPDLRVCHKKNN